MNVEEDGEAERFGIYLSATPPAGAAGVGHKRAAPETLATQKKQKSSNFRGVSWIFRANKWSATCRNIHLGTFTTEEDAALAYNEAAVDARTFKGARLTLNVIPPAGAVPAPV
jgi:hypothetical protein